MVTPSWTTHWATSTRTLSARCRAYSSAPARPPASSATMMTAIRMIDCRLRKPKPRFFCARQAQEAVAAAGRPRVAEVVAAALRRAEAAAGTSRSAPHRLADAARGSVRSAVPAEVAGAGAVASQGPAAGVAGSHRPADQAGRGVAAAWSPARFCLIGWLRWANASYWTRRCFTSRSIGTSLPN